MKREGGFTLIELMVSVAILAILASVVVPLAQVGVQRGKEKELKLALREIRAGIDAYKHAVDTGRIYRSVDGTGYPESLAALVEGSVDLKDPKGRKLYFLRRIPRDPMSGNEGASAEASWGKRSYQSEAEDPREGEDVYDVYSLSERIGLNGRPYREW
ncbi:MAG: ral secretion pathway protein GspG [Moraxellaceae bacterium]|nr:ral secretion pathway protein GspG [Moraxellaceae bacterium]